MPDTNVNQMSISDQNLVDELSSGDVTLPKLGKLLAATYVQTDRQSKVQEEHGQKLDALTKQVELMHPSVEELKADLLFRRRIILLGTSFLALAGATIATVSWTTFEVVSQKVAYVAVLDDAKIESIAAARDATLRSELLVQTDLLSQKLEKTSLTMRLELKDAMLERQRQSQPTLP